MSQNETKTIDQTYSNFETEWEEFAKQCIPEGANAAQRKDMYTAFVAGANVSFILLHKCSNPEQVSAVRKEVKRAAVTLLIGDLIEAALLLKKED